MADPLEITEEDKMLAWKVFFEHEEYPPIPYRSEDWTSRTTTEGLVRVLKLDRQRAAARGGAHAT